jgi:hypothetical protein
MLLLRPNPFPSHHFLSIIIMVILTLAFPKNEENSPNGQTQSFVYDGATKWACCIALRSPSAT